MLKFLDKNIVVGIPESQIQEAILYNKYIHIKLYNGAIYEILGEKNAEELRNIFEQIKEKSKYGNFINMREKEVS